jgi:hypothetical protein
LIFSKKSLSTEAGKSLLLIAPLASQKLVGLFMSSGVTVSIIEPGPYRLACAIPFEIDVVSPKDPAIEFLDPKDNTGRTVRSTWWASLDFGLSAAFLISSWNSWLLTSLE